MFGIPVFQGFRETHSLACFQGHARFFRNACSIPPFNRRHAAPPVIFKLHISVIISEESRTFVSPCEALAATTQATPKNVYLTSQIFETNDTFVLTNIFQDKKHRPPPSISCRGRGRIFTSFVRGAHHNGAALLFEVCGYQSIARGRPDFLVRLPEATT